jgi:hypothetical protein
MYSDIFCLCNSFCNFGFRFAVFWGILAFGGGVTFSHFFTTYYIIYAEWRETTRASQQSYIHTAHSVTSLSLYTNQSRSQLLRIRLILRCTVTDSTTTTTTTATTTMVNDDETASAMCIPMQNCVTFLASAGLCLLTATIFQASTQEARPLSQLGTYLICSALI